jgi:hypothetical protein
VSCIIDLTGPDLKGEVEGMEDDFEEHRMVEKSIASAWHEGEEVHRTVEDSFGWRREDRVRAWLRAMNKGMKASASSQILVSRFEDAICEVWMSVAARRKAA